MVKMKKVKCVEDIIENASKLEGLSFKELGIETESANKGLIGNATELIFGLTNDVLHRSDFSELGFDVELKTLPVRVNENKTHSAKERVSLSYINYNDDFPETFQETSTFQKIKQTLIMSYVVGNKGHKFGKAFWLHFSKPEMEAIEEDYQIIKAKIMNGKSHLLRDSDTTILTATRKGHGPSDRVVYKYSEKPAARRAWAFKKAFVDYKVKTVYDNLQWIPTLTYKRIKSRDVVELLSPFKGMTIKEIAKATGNKIPKTANKNQLTIMSILEKSHVTKEDIEKSYIKMKIQNLTPTNHIKDHILVGQVDYQEVMDFTFPNTEVYYWMSHGFVHILFDQDDRLQVVELIHFTDSQIRKAELGYQKFRRQVKTPGATEYISLVDDRFFHVKPRAGETITIDKRKFPPMNMYINKAEVEAAEDLDDLLEEITE